MPNKQYLGDAVYAEMDEYGRLVLTTEDGIQATNRIVLEPEVRIAMNQYIDSQYPQLGEENGQD